MATASRSFKVSSCCDALQMVSECLLVAYLQCRVVLICGICLVAQYIDTASTRTDVLLVSVQPNHLPEGAAYSMRLS